MSLGFGGGDASQTFQVVCFRNTSKDRSCSTAHASCKILKYLELVNEYFELLKFAYALSVCLAYKAICAVWGCNQIFKAAVTLKSCKCCPYSPVSDHPMQCSKKPYRCFVLLYSMFLLFHYFGSILLNCTNVNIIFFSFFKCPRKSLD